MIPIQCRRCGHIQDAGSALTPNDTCERCGIPIYGPKPRNPVAMAALAALTLMAAALIRMPTSFLVFLSVLMVIFIGSLAIGRRVRFIGKEARCDDCGCSMTITNDSGPGFIAITPEEASAGFGPAEICTACGRVWCASCFPTRPRNSCPCGQRRDSYEAVGSVTYLGPVRLTKALYHQRLRDKVEVGS